MTFSVAFLDYVLILGVKRFFFHVYFPANNFAWPSKSSRRVLSHLYYRLGDPRPSFPGGGH